MSQPSACVECLRRSQLLALLSPFFERHQSGAPGLDVSESLQIGNERLARELAPRDADQILAQIAAMSEGRLRQQLTDADCWASCRHDDSFPDALRETEDAPWSLIARGKPAFLADLRWEKTVALTGSKSASAYGRTIARNLARDLAEVGFTVISGLSFGIESCVHRGALEAGRSVAVLGSGPDVPYPAAQRSLWRRIGENGLVVSELPPGAAPREWTLSARSRIIAALAGMTVLVEAAAGSGSLEVVEMARGLGYEAAAVPGPVDASTSAACNQLLAEGGHVVRCADDVVEVMLRSHPKP